MMGINFAIENKENRNVGNIALHFTQFSNVIHLQFWVPFALKVIVTIIFMNNLNNKL